MGWIKNRHLRVSGNCKSSVDACGYPFLLPRIESRRIQMTCSRLPTLLDIILEACPTQSDHMLGLEALYRSIPPAHAEEPSCTTAPLGEGGGLKCGKVPRLFCLIIV
jgi:hypothetical protein